MKLLSPVISSIARLRKWRIDNWINHPVAAQREVLQHLVTSAQYTEFGRKYSFHKLFNVKEFKAVVPIHEYEDLKPYIERMMQGEENILWNEPVYWFAKSSGTSCDRSKFIPVSDESLQYNHYKANKDVLSNYYKYFPSSDLLTGKGLVVGGSHQISKVNDQVQYGDLSAVLIQNSPFWGQWLRTPELSIALLDEWETKIEKLAHATVDEVVTSIAGVPTWTLILLKRILQIKNKKTLKKFGPAWNSIYMVAFLFYPIKNNLKKLLALLSITWKCTMQVKGFLQHRKNQMMMAWPYIPSMAYFSSLCLLKNMENPSLLLLD